MILVKSWLIQPSEQVLRLLGRFHVNKASFVDKDAREHFGLKIHKRLIDIVNPTNQTIDSLMHLELPAGVEVEVKM